MMRVLAGIDGSERGDNAVEYACQLLDAKTDNLCLYYSPPKRLPFTRLESGLSDLARDALANAVFDKATKQVPQELRPNDEGRVIGQKKPCEGILAAAEETDADLIVVGAHNSTRRLSFFLGGTARKIAHESDVPVLLVREKQDTPTNGLRILILCDEDENWQRAGRAMDGFSWPTGSAATLFHVVESMSEERVEQLAKSAHASVPNAGGLIKEYRTNIAEQRAVRHRQLDEGRPDTLPDIVKNAKSKVSQGYVVDEVVREVREENIDLVVVGARRLGRVGRMLGSTTEALLTQCPCSLLIVHEAQEV